MVRLITADYGCPAKLGASLADDGIHFAVHSSTAERINLCLFDEADAETRVALPGRDGDRHFGFVPGLREGARYGFRAEGPFDPSRGLRFDASKLLVHPYARRLDRPFRDHSDLRTFGADTAGFVPRCIVEADLTAARPLPPSAPGFTYEVLTRGFTMRHPGVRPEWRGTVLAFIENAVLDHLTKLGVETVELMPLAAWIDERHLTALGLSNAWGYNPVTHMAPDPRLAPGGLADVRRAVEALHARGIRVLLDVVLNHSGESDEHGATLCYRGLDNPLYYRLREDDPALYVNDTGTGNTFAADRPAVVALFVDTLRAWARATGLDGFRYDLAPVLGRDARGFSPGAPFFAALAEDPLLNGLIHVAEPWDIGPGGYRVGAFPPPFLEWQDRFRDDVRRFWRGDRGMAGTLATRLAGSPDLFDRPRRGVDMVAAHDGFSFADLVMYERRHNEANGESNRDGHADNHSWNNGAEGPTDDAAVVAARGRDIAALLGTLFLSRANILLVAGDEFGRTQRGNNNAYCQDNETTWLDWERADPELLGLTRGLAAFRREWPGFFPDAFPETGDGTIAWLTEHGTPLSEAEWADPQRRFLGLSIEAEGARLLAFLNAGREGVAAVLPQPAAGRRWLLEVQTDAPGLPARELDPSFGLVVSARSVFLLLERV